MSHASLVADLGIVLGVAAAIGVLFRRLRQPAVLGYLLAGLIVGPYIPIPLFADVERTHELSEFGVVLVMFAVGLEFSLGRVAQVLPIAGATAAIEIGGLLWAGHLVGLALGLDTVGAVFVGASVAISSTMIVTKVFDDRPPPDDVRGFVLGVLVLQDVAAIVLIAAVTALSQGSGLDPQGIAGLVGRLFGVLTVATLAGLWIVPRLVRLVAGLGSPEILTVFAVGLCFVLASGAEHIGYSPALGAFLAGMLVAESGRRRRVEHLVVPLRDVFAAVFFVSIGMTVDPTLALEHFGEAVVVAVAVIVLQFTLVSAAGVLSGTGLRRATHAGLALGQIGEFGFIITGIGATAGVVPAHLFTVIVTAAVLTAFTTPLALRLAPRVAAGIERRLPARIRGGLSLYAAWLDDLRRGDTTSPTRSRIRRAFQVLVIDAVVIAALTVGASIGSDWLLGQLRDRAAIDESWAGVALVVAVIVLCSPFLRGIVRAARTLGLVLGSSVFPHVDGKRADLLSTSRRAMSVGVQLVALLATAIPLAALTQPFLPPGVGLLALLVLAVPTAVYLWRSTRDLQEHVHSATGALVEALRRGIALDAEPALEDLLHGLGDATAIHLPEGAPAVGRTLAELNLRVTTGATVLGIARPGGDIAAPSGSQRLQTGDTLAVAGPQDAVRWAREALLGVSEGDGDDAPPVEPA